MTKKVAVIGYPVKHSLSPFLHGYWLKKYNIDGEYGLLEVKPEDLKGTLARLESDGYVGCNLTIPHKEEAYRILGNNTGITAHSVGAVNTIYMQYGELWGSNSDVYGFVQNILNSHSDFDFTKGKAVVLGAGGAARAVVCGLIGEKVPEIIIVNRTVEKAEKVKEDLLKISDHVDGWEDNSDIKVVHWDERNEIVKDANILVNTTSLGMKGQPELDISLENIPKNALVNDIVYNPLETKLLKNAREHGNFVVDGLGMLLYQAVAGFEMWFGIKPEVTEDLREHVLSQMK